VLQRTVLYGPWQKHLIAKNITLKEMIGFSTELWHSSIVTCLFSGIGDEAVAKKLATSLHGMVSKLTVNKMGEPTQPNKPLKGAVLVAGTNPQDKNSALVLSYDAGVPTLRRVVALDMLSQLLGGELVHRLRENEQLAYEIRGWAENIRGRQALCIEVQSTVRDPLFLNTRVEALLAVFRHKLQQVNITQARAAQGERYAETYGVAHSEREAWHELSAGGREFHQLQHKVAELKKIRLADLEQLYNDYFAPDAKHRVKLAVMVYALGRPLPHPLPKKIQDGNHTKVSPLPVLDANKLLNPARP